MRRLPMTRMATTFCWPIAAGAEGAVGCCAHEDEAGSKRAARRRNTRERPRRWRNVLHDTCGEPALQEIKEEIRTPSLLKIRPLFVTPPRLRERGPREFWEKPIISARSQCARTPASLQSESCRGYSDGATTGFVRGRSGFAHLNQHRIEDRTARQIVLPLRSEQVHIVSRVGQLVPPQPRGDYARLHGAVYMRAQRNHAAVV